MMNPELFSIIQSKDMGIWPPSDLLGIGIWPYVKRLKRDKLKILDVGCMKGDNAAYFLELDAETNKIDKIYCEQSKTFPVGVDEVFKLNSKSLDKITTGSYDGQYDVVCVHHSLEKLDSELKTAYDKLSVGGLFCGSEHNRQEVKEALGKFRRDNKIGVPILISYNSWFWIKR